MNDDRFQSVRSYCSLPLAQVSQPDDFGPGYCCFGCRFAASVADSAGDDGQARRLLTRLGLAIFFSMNVMVFTVAMWSQEVYVGGAMSSPRAVAASPRKRTLPPVGR